MKKIVSILSALVVISSLGFADENNDYEEEADGFYLGLAYTHLSHDVDRLNETIVSEMDFHALSLHAGYKFNPYIAVEGRYGMTLGDPKDVRGVEPDDADITVWSIYVKPIYPVAPEFDIYALIGYSGTNAEDRGNLFNVDESGFSWGAGIVYSITEEFSIYVDYLVFYDGSRTYDNVIDSNNYGVSYKF